MLGVSIALLCAITWSLSLILLKSAGSHAHPLALNLGKNTLGLILLIPTAWIIDGPFPSQIAERDMLMMVLSGFFGVGLADAMLMGAMKYLSASKIAILECLFAPCILILSMYFFGESLTTVHMIGGLMIISSIFLILPGSEEQDETREATECKEHNKSRKSETWLGTALMSFGMLITAAGILMVKPSFETVPLFWIITIRMAAGVISSTLVMLGCKQPWREMNKLWQTESRLTVTGSFIISSYVALSLWIAGYKYLKAPLAAILNQTSTIFTVLLAVLLLKEQLTRKKILSSVLATIGVILISMH